MPSISAPRCLILLATVLLVRPAQGHSQEGDYATRDPLCARMLAPATDAIAEVEKAYEVPYFFQPIPPIIHHVWFGNPVHFEDERASRWQELARQYGYAYHLWTEQDDPYLRRIMGDELFAYMDLLRSQHHYDAASDICRYVLLEHLGGVYTDVDVAAPEVNGKLVDLRQIVDFQGLIVATERQVREVGNSAFYSANHIIMSAAHHPVMRQMVYSLLANRDAFSKAGGNWDRGAQFWTGQILWNMTLQGPFAVLPLTYLRQFNILWERRPDWPDYLYARYAFRCTQPGGGAVTSIHYTPEKAPDVASVQSDVR